MKTVRLHITLMDDLASVIFKSVESIFHTATVNGQQIVPCEERKTSPAISSHSDSVQTPAEIIGKEMGNIDHWAQT